jgi:hypothetical protein
VPQEDVSGVANGDDNVDEKALALRELAPETKDDDAKRKKKLMR